MFGGGIEHLRSMKQAMMSGALSEPTFYTSSVWWAESPFRIGKRPLCPGRGHIGDSITRNVRLIYPWTRVRIAGCADVQFAPGEGANRKVSNRDQMRGSPEEALSSPAIGETGMHLVAYNGCPFL